MFTLVSYYDVAAHPALAAIPGIADPHIRVAANDIYVPALNKILAIVAHGEDIDAVRMQSPSLRRMVNQPLTTIHSAPGCPPSGMAVAQNVDDFHLNPRTLDIAEALNAYCMNPAPGGAEYVFVWLMDALESLPSGEIFSIEGTTTSVGVLGTWVNGALVFTQTLPAGRYAVVGMRSESNIGVHVVVATRLVFPDISPRPGVVACHSAWQHSNPLFRHGALGSWGEFEHDAPPTIDCLDTADPGAAIPIILDLIQVRAGRR